MGSLFGDYSSGQERAWNERMVVQPQHRYANASQADKETGDVFRVLQSACPPQLVCAINVETEIPDTPCRASVIFDRSDLIRQQHQFCGSSQAVAKGDV